MGRPRPVSNGADQEQLALLSRARVWLVPHHSRRARLFRGPRRWLAALERVARQTLSIFTQSWPVFQFDIYKRARRSAYRADLSSLRCPTEPELVSIVLPVHNGAELLSEALESILSQTYARFELIAIDDGSTDDSAEILRDYASRDARLRVIEQENRQLPRTLSRGFRLARGEFLTWTSHDNRLAPDFLEQMVACLRRRPGWDMVYANEDIMDDAGAPLRDSHWYRAYQRPRGSEHIYLPEDPSALNTIANNYVGGAFLYRARMAYLLGDYSPRRFTTEDYDYWMRANALLTVRHSDFRRPIYQYRFHGRSLTSRDAELGITRDRVRLMLFDDFRRDFFLTPLVWIVEADPDAAEPQRLAAALRARAARAKQVVLDAALSDCSHLPRLWVPVVYVRVTADPATAEALHPPLPGAAQFVLATASASLPAEMDARWSLCLAHGSIGAPPRLTGDDQGWLAAPDIETLFSAVDICARSRHSLAIEAEVERPAEPLVRLSVVICTHRRGAKLDQAIASVARQTLPPETYEVLVVNNDFADRDVLARVARARANDFAGRPERLRFMDCPLPGLSHARNAALAEARGEVLCFLDDDAIAPPDWLEAIQQAFDAHPRVGVLGGHVRLVAVPRLAAWKSGWEVYWSQFMTRYTEFTEVERWHEFPWGANWCARRRALLEIGGFRTAYGRRGNDYGGGEEVVAASLIRQLGYGVGILPSPVVLHDVGAERYTLDHVKRTIRAATLVNYRGQANGHLPVETMPRGSSQDGSGDLGHHAQPSLEIGMTSRRAEFWEAAFRFAARSQLVRRQLQDLVLRLRRPISRKMTC